MSGPNGWGETDTQSLMEEGAIAMRNGCLVMVAIVVMFTGCTAPKAHQRQVHVSFRMNLPAVKTSWSTPQTIIEADISSASATSND